jgi:hypothetical protein
VSRVKNQHYVPRFYLKAFCANGRSLFVFDKLTGKTFQAGVANVASESLFYDLPARPGGPDDAQVVEKALSDLEAGFAGALKELLAEVERDGRFQPDIPGRKPTLAYFIALQYCRTRQFRDMYAGMIAGLSKTVEEKHALVQKYFEEKGEHVAVQPAGLTIPPESAPLEHAAFMFNGTFMQSAVPILMQHSWVIGENKSDHPFFTSDAPVVLRAHCDHSPYGGSGFGSKGVEIVFPLSARYVLILRERSFFPDWQYLEGKVLPMLPDWVQVYNSFQICEGYRYVYGPEDKFEQVRHLVEQFPDLRRIDRPRFSVG